MEKLLILHGWFGNPEINWYQYLKNKIEMQGYLVSIPKLVKPEKPSLKAWTRSALANFTIDSKTTIVGHSLGGILALKLAEQSPVKIKHLILVSGWDFWDLTPEHGTFFKTLINHEKVINNCKKITVVHSSNDPYTTIIQAEEMSKRLHADFVKIEDGGHLQDKDGFKEFPQLVEIIKL